MKLVKTALLVLLCLAVPFSVLGADKLIVKDSGGTTKFVVTDDGSVGVNVTAPTSKLHVDSNVSAQDIQGTRLSYTTSAATGYSNIGTYSEATSNPSTNSTSTVFALNGVARTAIGSSVNQGNIYGLRFTAQHRGTGVLSSAVGVNAYPYNGSTGTISYAYALYTLPWMASGTITNWYGVFIDNKNLGTGTIGNLYGIYVKEPTAKNYFAGNVGIGVTAPSYPIQLAGGAYSDGMEWRNASSRELKENIQSLSTEQAIVSLKELTPVTYNYKANTEDSHVGFIAEDVPDLVATMDRKSLSPMDIVAVLTKVVQEQQKAIDTLSKKLAEIERNGK